MREEKFTFTGAGGKQLPATLWLPEEPKLMMQIVHGMTEHRGCYETFAEQLTQRGMAAAAFDLRGHGENPGDPVCASFGEGGWQASLEDMRCFDVLLRSRFPELPQALMGFSLGSFLLREYLNGAEYPVAAAVILGTGTQPGPVLSLLKQVIRGQIRKAGFDAATPLVRKLSFGAYNRKFAPNRTDSDWLCSDEAELDAYLKDPLCRKDISAGLFWQLLDSMQRTGGAHAYDHWPCQMPVLMLSGAEDPVGDMGKGVRRVEAAMRRAGLTDIWMELLPGARHDLLHESSSGRGGDATEKICAFLKEELQI